jgi:hypothetical protein
MDAAAAGLVALKMGMEGARDVLTVADAWAGA